MFENDLNGDSTLFEEDEYIGLNTEFENTSIVIFPSELKEEKYVGPLYGCYVSETRIFNITGTVPHPTNANVQLLGYIHQEPHENSDELTGLIDEDGNLSFRYRGRRATVSYYSLVRELFSRNAGILESAAMLKKCACIIGCGSVGSLVAVELAKAGLGSFVLFDNDVFAYHNICRHQLDIFDVGKRKVDALKEKILSINPRAEVVTFASRIEDIHQDNLAPYLTEDDSIIIHCSDMRSTGHYANFLSEKYNVPFVSVGCGMRASTGEIFYYFPRLGMPCYACFCGEDLRLDTANRVTRMFYANEEAPFSPGIGIDIDYVSIIAVKLVIDILMIGEDGYQLRLLPHERVSKSAGDDTVMGLDDKTYDEGIVCKPPLYYGMRQLTLISNYPAETEDERNPEHPNYNPFQEHFDSPLDIVTGNVHKRECCSLCAWLSGEIKQ